MITDGIPGEEIHRQVKCLEERDLIHRFGTHHCQQVEEKKGLLKRDQGGRARDGKRKEKRYPCRSQKRRVFPKRGGQSLMPSVKCVKGNQVWGKGMAKAGRRTF